MLVKVKQGVKRKRASTNLAEALFFGILEQVYTNCFNHGFYNFCSLSMADCPSASFIILMRYLPGETLPKG